ALASARIRYCSPSRNKMEYSKDSISLKSALYLWAKDKVMLLSESEILSTQWPALKSPGSKAARRDSVKAKVCPGIVRMINLLASSVFLGESPGLSCQMVSDDPLRNTSSKSASKLKASISSVDVEAANSHFPVYWYIRAKRALATHRSGNTRSLEPRSCPSNLFTASLRSTMSFSYTSVSGIRDTTLFSK